MKTYKSVNALFLMLTAFGLDSIYEIGFEHN